MKFAPPFSFDPFRLLIDPDFFPDYFLDAGFSAAAKFNFVRVLVDPGKPSFRLSLNSL